MNTKDTFQLILNLLGLILAATGFLTGLRQYEKAQKWKRSEFAAAQLEKLVSNDELALACIFLDSNNVRVLVPKEFKALAEEETFVHDWSILVRAMTSGLDSRSFPNEYRAVIYRRVFDKFFDYLELINHYITIKLIDISDVSTLEYWLVRIAQPYFVEESVFISYLKTFNYKGTIQLMRKFRVLD